MDDSLEAYLSFEGENGSGESLETLQKLLFSLSLSSLNHICLHRLIETCGIVALSNPLCMNGDCEELLQVSLLLYILKLSVITIVNLLYTGIAKHGQNDFRRQLWFDSFQLCTDS